MEVKEFAYCSDKYQYTMGKSFMDCGNGEKTAVFNLFYRKAPENNNWAVVCGTDEVVEMIGNLGSMPEEFSRSSFLERNMLISADIWPE